MAGRGDYLFVTLHLKDGHKLLFAVDTGAPITVLDRSLSPKLGTAVTNVAGVAQWYEKNMTFEPSELYVTQN